MHIIWLSGHTPSLSPGVDIDLKDSNDKTVMDFLKDYHAPRANDIKKMIQGTYVDIYW